MPRHGPAPRSPFSDTALAQLERATASYSTVTDRGEHEAIGRALACLGHEASQNGMGPGAMVVAVRGAWMDALRTHRTPSVRATPTFHQVFRHCLEAYYGTPAVLDERPVAETKSAAVDQLHVGPPPYSKSASASSAAADSRAQSAG